MAFERKFKDGDKVKVIKQNSVYYGKIGIICSYYSGYYGKSYYKILFKDNPEQFKFYSTELEKVVTPDVPPKNNSTTELKVGMKVRIRKDAEKFQHIIGGMKQCLDTVCTIKSVGDDVTVLENVYTWDPKSLETVNSSEEITLPLQVGQEVTLLDGNRYRVAKGGCSKCVFTDSVYNKLRCNICLIKGAQSCMGVIGNSAHFELVSKPDIKISDLKPGTFVRIKTGLIGGKKDKSGLYINHEMSELGGTIQKVERILPPKRIILKNYEWFWSLECFDEIVTNSDVITSKKTSVTSDTSCEEESILIITKREFKLIDFEPESIGRAKRTIL